MRHGSLFSGIGGFDLAAEWSGWENMFHCEWNEFGQKILKHYWPEAVSYGDITKTDFTIWRGKIDILTGGFPCQPYSTAGKRKGKADDRHLWPEMRRAIREIQPGWIVGENVRGLTNWNGGLVFDEVQADLENEGYEVLPFLLPACAVNAPHRRDRIWFIAHNHNRNGQEIGFQTGWKEYVHRPKGTWDDPHSRSTGFEKLHIPDFAAKSGFFDRSSNENETFSDPASNGLRGQSNRFGESGQFNETSQGNNWQNFPTQPPLCSGNDGLSSGLDGITFSKWRNESIKGGGNAIVPQVAFQIFQAIESYNFETKRHI